MLFKRDASSIEAIALCTGTALFVLHLDAQCMYNSRKHYELGRRPCQPAFPGKVDRKCDSARSNQSGKPSALLPEGFVICALRVVPDVVLAGFPPRGI